jgi:hypothetical protein
MFSITEFGAVKPGVKQGNWLGGTAPGPKRPIFRHTSPILQALALLRPAKISFFWQKMVTFLSQKRPR